MERIAAAGSFHGPCCPIQAQRFDVGLRGLGDELRRYGVDLEVPHFLRRENRRAPENKG